MTAINTHWSVFTLSYIDCEWRLFLPALRDVSEPIRPAFYRAFPAHRVNRELKLIAEISARVTADDDKPAELRRLESSELALERQRQREHLISVAIGILMERYSVTANQSLVMLRNYARSHRLALDAAAIGVVERTANLDFLIWLVNKVREQKPKSNHLSKEGN